MGQWHSEAMYTRHFLRGVCKDCGEMFERTSRLSATCPQCFEKNFKKRKTNTAPTHPFITAGPEKMAELRKFLHESLDGRKPANSRKPSKLAGRRKNGKH